MSRGGAIFKRAPHFCSIHSQHAQVSIVGLFCPLIKPKLGLHIFKYPKALPNKITLYLLQKKKKKLSPILNLKIRTLSYAILFILFQSSVYTPLLTGNNSPQTKQNPQLSPPLKLSPHDPKKRKLDHYFLSSCFLMKARKCVENTRTVQTPKLKLQLD